MRRETSVVPDGGWGWVIVACSFLIHMFVVGTLYALSVLYVSWLDAFHNSKGYTSWILSLAVAVMFGIGPLPGFLSRRFSNRTTVIIGGLMMFLGFLSSVFAKSVLHLIFSIGIVAGIGAGCCYLPSVSMVAMYFDKKRSIAMGLSSAGLGVGAFLMPLYLNWMVEDYGWRGCMLILSALSLNMCVLGVLMRPLQPGQGVAVDIYDSDGHLYLEKDTTRSSSNLYSTGERVLLEDDRMQFCEECSATYYSQIEGSRSVVGCKHHTLPVIEISLLDNNVGDVEIARHREQRSHLTTSRARRGSKGNSAKFDSSNVRVSNQPPSMNPLLRNSTTHLSEIQSQSVTKDANCVGGSLQCMENNSSNLKLADGNSDDDDMTTCTKGVPASISSSLSSVQFMMSGNLYNALHSCRAVSSLMSLHSDNHTHENKCDLDTFDDTAEESDNKIDNNIETNLVRKSKCRRIRQKLENALGAYLSLIRNGTFMVFCVSNFLTNLSFFMPVLYMVDRAIDEGISKNEAAILVSLYGAGNIFGKLFFGWLADREIVDRLVIYMGCLALAGLATCMSPLCGDEQTLHGMYSFSFGCFIGSYCTLYPIVTVDLVGLEFVDESVGIILCFMGVATAFGSPLAGWIFDWTGSYTMAYALHGIFILVSAAMMIPTFVRLQLRKKQEGKSQALT